LLGVLAARRPEQRKKIIPELVGLLDAAVKRLTLETTLQADVPGDQNALNMAEVRSVCLALMKCGPDAAQIVAKKIVPQLKDLAFHKDGSVRGAAKALRKIIEAGPDALETSFAVNGCVVKQGQLSHADPFDRVRRNSKAKTFTAELRAGKTYEIEMASNEINSYLRLEAPTGQELAHDDDGGGFPHARILFNCQLTGSYRIICTTFAPATGSFTLTVLEEDS
jgi:hypothetical protein